MKSAVQTSCAKIALHITLSPQFLHNFHEDQLQCSVLSNLRVFLGRMSDSVDEVFRSVFPTVTPDIHVRCRNDSHMTKHLLLLLRTPIAAVGQHSTCLEPSIALPGSTGWHRNCRQSARMKIMRKVLGTEKFGKEKTRKQIKLDLCALHTGLTFLFPT